MQTTLKIDVIVLRNNCSNERIKWPYNSNKKEKEINKESISKLFDEVSIVQWDDEMKVMYRNIRDYEQKNKIFDICLTNDIIKSKEEIKSLMKLLNKSSGIEDIGVASIHCVESPSL